MGHGVLNTICRASMALSASMMDSELPHRFRRYGKCANRLARLIGKDHRIHYTSRKVGNYFAMQFRFPMPSSAYSVFDSYVHTQLYYCN